MDILFGFTVPEGKPLYIRRHHTVFTGMTDLAGKTTAMEGCAVRAAQQNIKALVFLTKRGEKGFETTGKQIPLYYRERADWRYVESLLAATMLEKMKFERAWIIRACKGTHKLKEVRENIIKILSEKKLRDFDRNIFTTLVAYFDLVLPTLEGLEFSQTLNLTTGINIMDLRAIYTKPEVQAIVIRSAMEYILDHENGLTPMLPEAWKFLPQGRNTPVKAYFEQFIREGATNDNFLWIDAQDLGGVDKEPLRNISTWIMGRMMQADEVKRILKQTLGADIEPRDIQTLPLGQFYVVQDDKVTRAYALPANIDEELGRKVARDELDAEYVKEILLKRREQARFITPPLMEPPRQIIDEKLVFRLRNLEEEIEKLWK